MAFTNLSCVTDLVDIQDPCIADQTAVEYFLDDLGLSLATAAKVADERYSTGRGLVDNKIRIALDDVMSHLMRNTTNTCDMDVTDGLICEEATKVAKAVFYRAAALVFKEISIDSKRYNEILQFSGNESLAQMCYLDSDLAVFTTLTKVKAGQYQKQLDKLEPLRAAIERSCCTDGTGQTSWRIVLP